MRYTFPAIGNIMALYRQTDAREGAAIFDRERDDHPRQHRPDARLKGIQDNMDVCLRIPVSFSDVH
ncbi:hypothetical protein [Acetobacter senegalensis]|uniref:hypothetical protein n=1 Tax=Acetobacter senegalensis TaxID=446692 RepID=UPI001EDB68A6|nr:hypothetical protein [Acetobacter senegalensis]